MKSKTLRYLTLLFFGSSLAFASAPPTENLVDQSIQKDVIKLVMMDKHAPLRHVLSSRRMLTFDPGGTCLSWTITSCANKPTKNCSNPDPSLNAVTCEITNCQECTPNPELD